MNECLVDFIDLALIIGLKEFEMSRIPLSANDCQFTGFLRLVGIDDVGGCISSLVVKLRAYYLV